MTVKEGGVQQKNAGCDNRGTSCRAYGADRGSEAALRSPDKPPKVDCTKAELNELVLTDSSAVGFGTFIDPDNAGPKAKNLFLINPPVVNFGSFTPLEVQSKTLCITNISPTPVRFCILQPERSAFRISYEKKSCLAPGISQIVEIYFVPPAWQFPQSSLKIVGVPVRLQEISGTVKSSATEPYVLYHVPLSSFPQLRNLQLPRFLNFGSVPINATKRQLVKLSNPHKVGFQFAVKVVVRNPAFSVEPLCGDVNAESTQVLTVSYTPQFRATAFFAIEVHIADFASKPFRVDAIGSCGEPYGSHAHETIADHNAQENVTRVPMPICNTFQESTMRSCFRSGSGTKMGRKQPKESSQSVFVRNGSRSEARSSPSCREEAVTGGGIQLTGDLQRPAASGDGRKLSETRVETLRRADGLNAPSCDDDTVKVSHFNRRWKAMTRSVGLKIYKTTVLGEAPTTELKRQRLLSKRRCDALELLKEQSEQNFCEDSGDAPPETVVVPSRWIPHQVQPSTGRAEAPLNNLFRLRRESIEKFARVVSAFIRRKRALRRLYTLQKTLKLRQTPAISATGTTDSAFNTPEKSFTDDFFTKSEAHEKEPETFFIRPQRTTYQEIFQLASAKLSTPAPFLRRSKIDVSDVFKSLDNYKSMTPLPPLDYEIMRLPDMEVPNPAWHLEPTERRLHDALLGPRASSRADGRPACAQLSEELTFPPVLIDPPVMNAAHFVAPPTTEFRLFIPLPKSVETDLGYCFRRVQPENAFKRGPRLSLPCLGDTTVSTAQRSSSTWKSEDLLLEEIRGVPAVYGLRSGFTSSPCLGTAVGHVAREQNSACKMSDTDSDGNGGSIDIPAPPFEKYAQSESGDESCPHGTSKDLAHGKLKDFKYEEFVQTTMELSESWGRRNVEWLKRLTEVNAIIPAELRLNVQ